MVSISKHLFYLIIDYLDLNRDLNNLKLISKEHLKWLKSADYQWKSLILTKENLKGDYLSAYQNASTFYTRTISSDQLRRLTHIDAICDGSKYELLMKLAVKYMHQLEVLILKRISMWSSEPFEDEIRQAFRPTSLRILKLAGRFDFLAWPKPVLQKSKSLEVLHLDRGNTVEGLFGRHISSDTILTILNSQLLKDVHLTCLVTPGKPLQMFHLQLAIRNLQPISQFPFLQRRWQNI